VTDSPTNLQSSRRDPERLAATLEGWLREQLPGTDPAITAVAKPDGNGMSSDTILFDARWHDDGELVEQAFVARIEPEADDVPVFPSYDLGLQHRVMALVAEHTPAPVPAPVWIEDDPAVLGAPFFVMERFGGRVPPDVLPYTFPDDNFVVTATPEQRDRMCRSAARVLAEVHRITPDRFDLDFLLPDVEGDTPLERHLAHWEDYKDWATEGRPSDLLDECFDWLWDHLPTDLAEPCLSWGDARIGNLLFEDFEVTGVLDWEMASVAPPEVDLGWMTYLHRFFQDLAVDLGSPGLPDFLRPADVTAAYHEHSACRLGDLRWPMAYAAFRHGVIMRRIGDRRVAFGEITAPEDPDEGILHRATIRRMLDGTYWGDLSF